MGALDHKVAIVTGAASGIGKATAELFRCEGATVVAADRMGGAGIVPLDAGSEAEVDALVEKTVADFGGIDIVFANAGISGGLASIDDVKALLKPEYAMLEGAITGRALYDGRLDAKEALALIAAA